MKCQSCDDTRTVVRFADGYTVLMPARVALPLLFELQNLLQTEPDAHGTDGDLRFFMRLVKTQGVKITDRAAMHTLKTRLKAGPLRSVPCPVCAAARVVTT